MSDVKHDKLGPGIWELFDDPAFQIILQANMSRCLSWEEFLSFRMPLSMSPLAMWDLLLRMSRYCGIELPIPDLENQEHWYFRTYELTDTIQKVTHACGVDSPLYNSMMKRDNQHFLMNVRMADTIAAARLDGIDIPETVASGLAVLGKAPRTPIEQLISNTLAVTNDLSIFVDLPFTRELCFDLYNLLTCNVNLDELAISERIPLGTGLFEWEDALCEQYAERQLDCVLAWANHYTGNKYDHYVLRALLIPDSFRFYRPFKLFSYQIGRILSYIYALKHNLPVFCVLPASCVKLNWDKGLICPPAVSFDRPTFEDLRRRSPGNLTCLQTLVSQLMLIALHTVEHYVFNWENRDIQMQEILKKDKDINYRQRSILVRALRKPEAEFTINYHKKHHDIAYPTARADFLELVEKGYLVQCKRGKAFVFRPDKRLQEMFINMKDLCSLDVSLMINSGSNDGQTGAA